MVEDEIEQLRQEISLALDAEDTVEISKILSGINEAEIALLLDSLPSALR